MFFGSLFPPVSLAFKPKLYKNSFYSKDNDTDVFMEGSLVNKGCSFSKDFSFVVSDSDSLI